KEIARTYANIERFLAAHPELERLRQLYESVRGVGPVTSITITAEMGDMADFDDPRQAVAFAGLVPRMRQSGTSVHGQGGISKRGNKRVRTALYMPALNVKRFDTEMRAFAQRLHDRGKPAMVVIIAVMRKLLHILWGIAHSGQPRKIFSTKVENII